MCPPAYQQTSGSLQCATSRRTWEGRTRRSARPAQIERFSCARRGHGQPERRSDAVEFLRRSRRTRRTADGGRSAEGRGCASGPRCRRRVHRRSPRRASVRAPRPRPRRTPRARCRTAPHVRRQAAMSRAARARRRWLARPRGSSPQGPRSGNATSNRPSTPRAVVGQHRDRDVEPAAVQVRGAKGEHVGERVAHSGAVQAHDPRRAYGLAEHPRVHDVVVGFRGESRRRRARRRRAGRGSA